MSLATFVDCLERALYVITLSVLRVLPVGGLLSNLSFRSRYHQSIRVITACHMHARHTRLPALPSLEEVLPRKVEPVAEGVEEHACSMLVLEGCTFAQSLRQRHGASSDLSAPSAPTSS